MALNENDPGAGHQSLDTRQDHQSAYIGAAVPLKEELGHPVEHVIKKGSHGSGFAGESEAGRAQRFRGRLQ